MKGAPGYSESLKEMIRSFPNTRLLSKFWSRKSDWPQGNSKMMFVGEAIDEIGRAQFNEEWTGSEFSSQRWIGSFPPFAGTLEYYWEQVRATFPPSRFRPSSEASWEGAIPPPFKVEAPITKEGLKALMEARHKRLAEEGKAFRTEYDRALAQWNKARDENEGSRARLQWVSNWIAMKGRDGDLKTYLRVTNTDARAGNYQEAPEGFWETERVIESRFSAGSLKFELDGRKADSFYIFISRPSLGRCLSELAPFETPANQDDLHYSPYMRGIIDAIRALNITPSRQPTKGELIHHFIVNWKGPGELTPKMADRMATIVREYESQAGAGRKNWPQT